MNLLAPGRGAPSKEFDDSEGRDVRRRTWLHGFDFRLALAWRLGGRTQEALLKSAFEMVNTSSPKPKVGPSLP